MMPNHHITKPVEVPELVPPSKDDDLGSLFANEDQKGSWERLFDLGNEEVLKEKEPGAD